MSPKGLAVRGVAAFAPDSLPLLSRRPYSLELITTLLFSLVIGCIDGGVIAVFTKQTFAGVVHDGTLNYAVAFLGATAELANILSFIWSSAAHGRAKVAFINWMQIAIIVLVGVMALLPQSPAGLCMLIGAVVLARTCWSGILTIRPTVWRANYGRGTRAGIVGRLSTVQVLVIAAVGMTLGWILDHSRDGYRIAVPVACVLALGAVAAYARVRVRGERAMIRKEREGAAVMKPWMGPLVVWRVLRQDPWYARFMIWMFVLGFGNLMIMPVLVITLRDQFNLNYLASILITSSIPAMVMPLAIPMWARLLDRAHVVRFRSIHCWTFVVAGVIFLLGAVTHHVGFMFAGAVVQGIAFGGGSLAWNLGHVDFAPPSETSQYMATHVTLNGVRGLIAPFFAVTLYQVVESAGGDGASWLFAGSLAVTIAGSLGFVSLRHRMGHLAASTARGA